MSTSTAEAAFASVRDADPSTLSRDGCEQLLVEVRRLRSWLASVEVSTTRRARELSAEGRSEAPESLISGAGGCTGKDAKNVEERTDVCDEAPTLGDALAEGDLALSYLDAIAWAARDLPDEVRAEYLNHADILLGRAERLGLESFRRECRRLAKRLLAHSRTGSDADELAAQRAASKVSRWIDRSDGMHHTHLVLDPVRDSKLSSAFNTELARLRAIAGNVEVPWQQLQVDAMLNALAGIRTPSKHDEPTGRGAGQVDTDTLHEDTLDEASGPPTDGHDTGHQCRCRVDRVPEATLLISYDWLIGEAPDGICETENGTPLPIATVRRLCCDAEILPTVIGGSGEVLDQGRAKRTATIPQRRALRSMHRGCAFPGCGVGFDATRIHHVVWWWAQRGRTDLENLLPLCERHHHLVHEGGWHLELDTDPERTATWIRPDGVIHHRGPTVDRVGGGPD